MVEKEEKIIRPAKMRNRDSFERTIFEKKILFHPRENPRCEGKPPSQLEQRARREKGDFSNWSERRFKGLILSATLRCIRNLNYRFKLVRHSSLFILFTNLHLCARCRFRGVIERVWIYLSTDTYFISFYFEVYINLNLKVYKCKYLY